MARLRLEPVHTDTGPIAAQGLPLGFDFCLRTCNRDVMTATRPYPPKPDTVYFFGTCLVDLFYPQAGLAGMELLRREGVRVVFPQDQTCCSQPAWNSGYRDQARRVARAQLDCFAAAHPVVVPSGSCAGMIRRHYPVLFRGDPDERRAVDLARRTFELTEFLVNVLDVRLTDLGAPVRVALHVSCSARRELKAATEHAALLRQLRNVEVLEPQRHEECCGFGGTFAVKHPEISAAMVRDKADALAATGAELAVSGDCGCLMNIDGHLRHRGSTLATRHIAEFLWERTREHEN